MEKKKVLGIFGTVALTAAIAVSGTLAYLSFTSDEKVNKFTSDAKVSGDLIEKDWTHGETGWNDYLPGESTGKNPKIEIAPDSEDAYIAMKVIIEDTNGNEISLNQFTDDYATLSYNGVNGLNPDFEKHGDLYIYKNVVAKGTSSPALFDKVTVNTGILKVYKTQTATETIIVKNSEGNVIRTEQGQVLVNASEKVYIVENGKEVEVTNDTKLPSFNIKVTGYAVQASGTQSTYKDLLIALAK